MSETELQTLHAYYQRLVVLTREELSLTRSHSVEEAEKRALHKLGR